MRWIVEKLAKRCGFEEVAQHMPEAHMKLLSHIRKENSRKDRRRSEGGSQVRQLCKWPAAYRHTVLCGACQVAFPRHP